MCKRILLFYHTMCLYYISVILRNILLNKISLFQQKCDDFMFTLVCFLIQFFFTFVNVYCWLTVMSNLFFKRYGLKEDFFAWVKEMKSYTTLRRQNFSNFNLVTLKRISWWLHFYYEPLKQAKVFLLQLVNCVRHTIWFYKKRISFAKSQYVKCSRITF